MNLPLCGFGPVPIVFVKLWDGRSPFRLVNSCVPTKEEFQISGLGKSEGTTQSMVKIWGLGAWESPYAVSSSSHLEALLGDWDQAEGHNVCL